MLDFLSRLCGGEAFPLLKSQLFYFLSRLCGGEEQACEKYINAVFLSRLCGGEVKLGFALVSE